MEQKIIVAKVDTNLRDAVQAAFLEKMSTLDLISYLSADKSRDHEETLQNLKQENIANYAKFSILFEQMCRQYAPDISQDILHLDFLESELYYMEEVSEEDVPQE